MVRKIHVSISLCFLLTVMALMIRPFSVKGRGVGFYNPRGPFQKLSGEFNYDYKRYGAVGKDWERGYTLEMPYAAVTAHALNPAGGSGGWPAVEFIVSFLGPMRSDNPKCTFEISGGGEANTIEEMSRRHLKVLAVPKVIDGSATHDIPKLQSEVPWTIRFSCSSE